jgi:hypothetical protein
MAATGRARPRFSRTDRTTRPAIDSLYVETIQACDHAPPDAAVEMLRRMGNMRSLGSRRSRCREGCATTR